MRTHTSTIGALLALLIFVPAVAQADPRFAGDYELEGRYSTRRATAVELKVVADAQPLVTRTGKYTGWRFRRVPAFTWTSEEVSFHGRIMRVTYRLGSTASVGNLIDALDPDSVDVNDARGVFRPDNVIEALYIRSDSDDSLRELAINMTKSGGQRWWSWIRTSGRRVAPASNGPTVTLTTDHPNASLQRTGGLYVLTSDESGDRDLVGFRPQAHLSFEGHTITLTASHDGLFSAYRLPRLMPEGYSGRQISRVRDNGEVHSTFEILKDAPTTLSSQEAIRRARDGLVAYIQNERIDDADWRDYFPDTWPELVADGIMDGVSSFGAKPDAEIHRLPDKYIFVDRGPYDLYTEVHISKADGSVISAYVEID